MYVFIVRTLLQASYKYDRALLAIYVTHQTLKRAGGWKCPETLLRCYQQPDERTMLDVVLGGAELRFSGVRESREVATQQVLTGCGAVR